MVIGGKPRLACDTFLSSFAAGRPIVIEPLRKFPVVRDLVVDRSVIRENLKAVCAWMDGSAAAVNEAKLDRMYDASRCLQCGCCLEVCPNFCPGDSFVGAAGAIPLSRLIHGAENGAGKGLKRAYDQRVYRECGKSLACMDVCPAHIDIGRTLSSTNALAVWKK
jgi:succinate dehydrogenase / fumarate reductase iron-sulfur subunit